VTKKIGKPTTITKKARLRAALVALLQEHARADTIPTSARFLFYELVQRGIIPKARSTPGRRADQDMIDALKSLRDDGVIPWDWIVDETRHLDNYSGYPSVREGLAAMLDVIDLDPWAGNEPLILCESRSLAGVLRALCSEYRVKIAATNGQVGGFLHTVIGPALELNARVLYLGDLDLAGGDIEANTRRVLETIVAKKLRESYREAGRGFAERDEYLCWERLALTAAQVATYNLPKITKRDRRFTRGGGVHEAVETEALSQAVIIAIVRRRLDELLPEPLADVLEREQQQRADFQRYLDNYSETGENGGVLP
jgi:hypothetical protein